jgi:hypothetical protein
MKGFRLIPVKAAAIGLVVLATVAAGCGEKAEKRAVDARTEVVHFFAADAPVVAVLRPEPVADVLALNRAAAPVPAWRSLLGIAAGPLLSAGLTGGQITRLVSPHEEIAGIQSSALALGAPTPADLHNGRPLLVLATDQSELMSHLFEGAAARADVVPAGKLHDATLYKNRGDAYAVRDGVLVSAPRLADVRTAILRRDGDSDLQLDEDVVGSLFNGLAERGPLLVYADLGQIRKADPGLSSLARLSSWAGMLGAAAASLQPSPGGLHVEGYANSTGGDLVAAGLRVGTEPAPITVSPDAGSLLPPGPARWLLTRLAPIHGEATGSSDQVRVNLRVGG